MRLLYKKKNFKIFLISGLLIILGVFVVFNYFQALKWRSANFTTARASINAKVRGWAWGENMGWISMNCYNDFDYNYTFENCCPGGNAADCESVKICQGGSNKGMACSIDDDCPGSSCSGLAGGDYGVYYDAGSGEIRGYAWSDKVGWICFGESCKCADCENCNDYINCNGCSNCPSDIKPPHGWPFSWACVGRAMWICSNNHSQICSSDNQCAGDCIFACSGDGEEDFLDISAPNTPCYSVTRDTLKAHWKMDAMAGDIMNALEDSSIYTNTLMCDGDLPILDNGKFNDALWFNGTNHYIYANDSDSLSVTGNLTVEAWIKRGAMLGTEQTVIGKWEEGSGDKSYRLWFDEDDKLNFSVAGNANEATITQLEGVCFGYDNDGTDACSSDNDCAVYGNGAFCRNPLITDTAKWHHIAGKYMAGYSTSSLQLFVDGIKVDAECDGIVPVFLPDKDDKLYIGAKKNSSGSMDTYFNGVIDNIAVWSCDNVGFLRGRSAKDIWADAKMEISGWAKIVALGDSGWLKLRGFTKAGKVWGLYLDDYDSFYTISGYMANRHVDTSMDADGLVAHWLMDEANWASGANPILVKDSSPSGNNNGTANGAIPNVQGIFNSAGEFDGNDDYIDCGSNDNLEVPTTTIQAWVKRAS
ncbi:hypothetical protein B6D52_03145, partial [Candidatus Parcubacteria bacterium 4484_255]